MSGLLIRRKSSLLKDVEYYECSVHLTILTKMIHRTEEDDYQCICANHIGNKKEDEGNIFKETELVPSLKVPISKEGKIKLVDVVNKLRILGYPVTGSMINLFMKLPNEYILIGADPLDSNFVFDQEDVDMSFLKIKLINYLENEHMKQPEVPEKEDNNDNKRERRTKERKIGFIIEKVNAWRKLYNGFYNEKGEHTRYSLVEAAKIIDISKKSLDDYLLQLRLGRKYGFDFNKNQNERVGMLRVFVKSHRHTEAKDK